MGIEMRSFGVISINDDKVFFTITYMNLHQVEQLAQ